MQVNRKHTCSTCLNVLLSVFGTFLETTGLQCLCEKVKVGNWLLGKLYQSSLEAGGDTLFRFAEALCNMNIFISVSASDWKMVLPFMCFLCPNYQNTGD